MVSPSRERVPPANFQSPYRLGCSPANGGAEALTAPGRRGRKHRANVHFAQLAGVNP